nr:L,D-transpeptidase family protein [Sphingomicrobium sediminis]
MQDAQPVEEAASEVAEAAAEVEAEAQDAQESTVKFRPYAYAPAEWNADQAEMLAAAIDNIYAHGLDPADYDAAGLRALIEAGEGEALSAAATERFNKLSGDIALGHVRGEDRVDWYIVDTDMNGHQQRALLDRFLGGEDLRALLEGLAPTHPQYAALQNALATELAKGEEADAEAIADIRSNLDRWRWLPRDLGDRYIIVNVPAYTVALVEDGRTVSRHRGVAGAVDTPTPQLMAEATGVIFNPYWNVPKSIEPEVRGKAGYEKIPLGNGEFRYRQPPGPNNSLGMVKFVMYNEHAIYLHDTNARGLFSDNSRAYSHGCIRTENILGLATMLLEEDGGDWSGQKTIDVVNSGKNTGAQFVNPLPVYIVYFSVAAKGDGSIIHYNDVYSRDAQVIAALDDAPAIDLSPAGEELGEEMAEAF